MSKRIVLSFLFLLMISSPGWTDTIYLKNGKVVTGEIIDETKYSIKVKSSGIPYTYYRHEIQKIESEHGEEWPVRYKQGEQKQGEKPPEVITEQKKELVIRLLEANGARDTMSRMFAQILSNASVETQEGIRDILRADEIILRLVPVYGKYYTEEELTELIMFYKGHTGRKHLELTPRIMEETMLEAGKYFKEKIEAMEK